MSLNAALNIGKLTLMANQTALQVISHNVANVNTEGYTRQNPIITPAYAVSSGRFSMGTGVEITAIERVYNSFITKQIFSEKSLLGKWDIKDEMLSHTEVIFNESIGGGINENISEFFNAWQSLSSNPQNETLRQAVMGRGNVLSDSINAKYSSLKNLIKDINDKVIADIDLANQIFVDIARVNKLIHEVENSTNTANDLRDQRDGLLNKLSTYIDVNYYEESNREVSVFTTKGRPLVSGEKAFRLVARPNDTDASVHDITWENVNGNLTNISSEISEGEFRGLLDVRDSQVGSYLKSLDSVVAELVTKVNSVHTKGYGLDQSTDLNFFDPLNTTAKASTLNTGTGVISSSSIADPSVVTSDQFEMIFTGLGSFRLDNITTGATDGTYTYTSGTPIARLQQLGINLTITGAPAVGDKFVISASEGATGTFKMNQVIANNSRKIAAGKSLVAGDGSNALEIANIQNSKIIGRTAGSASGTYTFDDYYNALVGNIGNDAAVAKDNVKINESVLLQLENRREQISGVSIDEEMINMVKFQSAYSAAAKLISTVDQMMDEILNLIR